MKWSNLFFYNNHFEKNHQSFELIQLMEKACMFSQESAGIYSAMSLGQLLEDKINKVIDKHMVKAGFSKIRLSIMQDGDLWEKTQRIDVYGEELFKLRNRKNKIFCLSATAEESVTNLYMKFYHRQKAHCNVYQINTKFRDEMRARGGLIRAKEFIMKDAYSFGSKESIAQTYDVMMNTYKNIFNELGLSFYIKEADSGEIGGSISHEFCVKVQGDDEDLEVGHIFNLGTKYSEKFGLLDDQGNLVHMACFGIGVSRLLMAILATRRDALGFWGDDVFNTFDYVVTAVDYEKNIEVKSLSDNMYNLLSDKGYNVLLDDRSCNAGKKLHDSELICIQNRIVISTSALKQSKFELLRRSSMKKEFLEQCELLIL